MGEVTLDGRVAIIADGGSELGRAIALALSARGVRIVVCGPQEKPLGDTVGHVVFAGGKARHVVGSLADAAARARDVFGALDIVVGESNLEAPRRLVVRAPAEVDPDHVAELVVAMCAGKVERRVLTLTVG
jgi:NAD(P)-dependent dehydrogenase (short-subunit alcohol dehydrogenase family)